MLRELESKPSVPLSRGFTDRSTVHGDPTWPAADRDLQAAWPCGPDESSSGLPKMESADRFLCEGRRARHLLQWRSEAVAEEVAFSQQRSRSKGCSQAGRDWQWFLEVHAEDRPSASTRLLETPETRSKASSLDQWIWCDQTVKPIGQFPFARASWNRFWLWWWLLGRRAGSFELEVPQLDRFARLHGSVPGDRLPPTGNSSMWCAFQPSHNQLPGDNKAAVRLQVQ